jgi:hypothetical protein
MRRCERSKRATTAAPRISSRCNSNIRGSRSSRRQSLTASPDARRRSESHRR